jgi:hypothetical protein
MHIAREGGKHYTTYRSLCEEAGIIPNPRCAPLKNPGGAGSVQSSMDTYTVPLQKPQTWTREGLFDNIVKLIVADDQAYQLVDKPEFRALLMYQRPNTTERDIPHRQTVADEIYAKSLKVRGLLREQFKNNDSRISFTFDAGTSRASDPYLAVTAHWIDSAWKMHEQIIGFPEIEGPHTGANIGSILADSLAEYGLLDEEKVCVVMLAILSLLTPALAWMGCVRQLYSL